MALKSLLVAASVLIPGLASGATIVENGSFEDDPGVVSPGIDGFGNGANFATLPTSGANFGIWLDVPGWTVSSEGLEIQGARTIPFSPKDGQYYAELDPVRNATISQDVTLEAGLFDLSFFYSPRVEDPDTNGLSFALGPFVSGTLSGPDATSPVGAWTEIRRRFTVADAGIYTLSFAGTGTPDSRGAFLDDVSISPVPLPAGFILLGSAIIGFGTMGRRKRKG